MRIVLSCAVLLFFALPKVQAQAVAIPGDLLIMLEPGTSAQKVADELGTLNGVPTGMRVVEEVSKPMRTWLLRFDPERAAQSNMLRAARSHKAVRLAQNNHHVELRDLPNDTQYGQQWHHENINSEAAWAISTGGLTADGDTIVVCIIENCDMPHPDLIANAWFNHHEIPNNDQDDDGNGYVDDFRGWNPNANNDNVYSGSHGTQVAGMIGATGNNELGVAGANWAVKMMVVFNSGANDAGVLASHSYPLTMRRMYNETNGAQGAFVVATNASWGVNGGQPADSPIWCAMYDSLGVQGVLNCGATANNNVNVDVVGDLPTACPSDFMISVTATDINDERTFSAYGQTTIDVGAPGEDVFTTRLNNTYGTATGTSFASPLTAGVVGLLYSAPCAGLMTLVKADPEQGARYVREMLLAGVDPVANLATETVTGGRINAGNSMQLIMSGCGACPPPYRPAVQTITINSALVSWQSVGGGIFDLRYRQTNAALWTEVNDLTEPGYVLGDLEPCTPYELQVRNHCEEDTSAFSNLFSWTSDGCCVPPSDLTRGFVGTNIINVSWTAVLAASDYDVRYAVLGTTDFTTISAITGTALEITPLLPCTNYTMQVRSNCHGTPTAWSTAITARTLGCGACSDQVYCVTTGGNTNGEWISRVKLGTIDNDSSNDDGYGDYTDQTTDLAMDTTYRIRLEPDYSEFQFMEWFHVWVDLDQNGSFDEPNELVFDSGSADNDPVEGDVLIPTTAALGSTRMRVIMRYSAAPREPCAQDFDYGEVEDYCVNIIEASIVGLPSQVHEQGFMIFPQPANGMVTVRSSDSFAGKELTVVDAMGRVVYKTTLTGRDHQLDTNTFASGTYTVLIGRSGAAPQRGRLVVARTH